MGAINDDERVIDYAIRVAKYKAKRLVGTCGFVEADTEDIEQELLLDLFRRLPYYNPARSQPQTFINRVMEHKLAEIVETHRAAKRGYGHRPLSLHKEMESEEGDSVPMGELLDERECFHTLGWSGRLSDEQLDLKIDLENVVSKLPPELRETCERLKIQTVIEVSQEMRSLRSTVYRRIERIRKILADKKLDWDL